MNTLTDLSVIVSDDLNNLYKFDTNGNQLWKTNVGYIISYIDCDNMNNIYITCTDSTDNYTLPNKSYKYNLDGNKIFEYTRKDNKGGNINFIFTKYDKTTNHIIVLYCINTSSASIYFWDTYDLLNNLLSNVIITQRIQFEGIEFCSCLSTGELIIFTNTNFNYSIDKIGLNGNSIAGTVLEESPDCAAFNIVNDNRIAIYRSDYRHGTGAYFEIFDSNFNSIQTQISTLPFTITNEYNFKCFNDYNFIINRSSLSTKTNKICMCIYDKTNNIIEYNKELELGLFDYDNKYLYYSKNTTNKISKINFDSTYVKKDIQNKDIFNKHNLILDDNDNIYYLDLTNNGSYIDVTLYKCDINLNIIYNNTLKNFGLFGTSTDSNCLFFYDNSQLYLINFLGSNSLCLSNIDLNGALISNNQIDNFGTNITGITSFAYDIKNKQIILTINNNLIKYNLNGTKISTNNISIYANSITIDINSNYYIQSNDIIKKYNNNVDLIFTINDCSGPAIINNDDVDNNIYIINENGNYEGIRIYNQSGSYTQQLINANSLYLIKNGFCKNNILYIYGSIFSSTYNSNEKNILCFVNNNNQDEPVYFYINNNKNNTYVSNIILDKNDNIVFMVCEYSQVDNPTNHLYKIPAIKNTNSYQIFKGYKLKPIQ